MDIDISGLKTMGLWIVFIVVFIAQLLGYTWCRVQCIKTGYEISKETAYHQELIALQNNLKIEMARLKSPNRIGKIAKNQLGLVTPSPEQIRIIHETK